MLALTKKTDYALIALAHLARQPEGVVSARAIAAVYHLPLPILTNILKTLAHAGVVVSERGAAGGYGLARPAETITLHELIAVIEGPFRFVRCFVSEPETNQSLCDLEATCPIRLPAHRIRERLKDFLENVTLADLIQGAEASTGPQQTQPLELAVPAASDFAR